MKVICVTSGISSHWEGVCLSLSLLPSCGLNVNAMAELPPHIEDDEAVSVLSAGHLWPCSVL